MSEKSDYQTTQTFSVKRLIPVMIIVSVIFVAGSLWFREWRVTLGTALGSLLSILNFWWSSKSLKAVFDKNIDSAEPKFSVTVYFLRYLTLGTILGLAYYFNLISIIAALFGLLTFVTAILAAAFIQLFFGLFKREEI